MSEEINREILAELRKMKRVFYVLVVLLILNTVPAFQRSFSRVHAPAAPTWSSVDAAMQKQDFPQALADAQALVKQQPNYAYGETYLGLIYISMGDLTNAETHYVRAHELFPNEECWKDVTAVRKRLAAQPLKLFSK